MLKRLALAGTALVLVTVLACQQPPTRDPGSTVPVAFLQQRVGRALEDLDGARASLYLDSTEVSERLAGAHLQLLRLDEYYLPLLAAREQVARARSTVASRSDDARSAVDSAEAVLLGIVRGHGRHLQGEMREPLERLEDVRTALAAGNTEEARELLRRLESHLESIFFRGELVLQESELD